MRTDLKTTISCHEGNGWWVCTCTHRNYVAAELNHQELPHTPHRFEEGDLLECSSCLVSLRVDERPVGWFDSADSRREVTLVGRKSRFEWIREVLGAVGFAPSCVDMAWEWELLRIDEVSHCEDAGSSGEHGWLLRTSFQRPDTDTGRPGRGWGRWWHMPPRPSRSAVVKTAWLACRQIVEHELMEAFQLDGVRVFDPHASVDDLVETNRGKRG